MIYRRAGSTGGQVLSKMCWRMQPCLEHLSILLAVLKALSELRHDKVLLYRLVMAVSAVCLA